MISFGGLLMLYVLDEPDDSDDYCDEYDIQLEHIIFDKLLISAANSFHYPENNFTEGFKICQYPYIKTKGHTINLWNRSIKKDIGTTSIQF